MTAQAESEPDEVPQSAADPSAMVGAPIQQSRRARARRDHIRAILSSRGDIRDIVLLNELLGPPVGVRDRRSVSPP